MNDVIEEKIYKTTKIYNFIVATTSIDSFYQIFTNKREVNISIIDSFFQVYKEKIEENVVESEEKEGEGVVVSC